MDKDILIKLKDEDYCSGFLGTAGNVWLNQLVNDTTEEYTNITGGNVKLRKRNNLTTIINRLAKENQRVLQNRNGEWAQLTQDVLQQYTHQT